MKKYTVADAHCDFLYEAATKQKSLESYGLHTPGITLDGLVKGNVKLQVFAAWSGSCYDNSYNICLQQMDIYNKLSESYSILHPFCGTLPDNDSISTVLSIEGGGGFASLEDLERSCKRGVKMLSLTWNHKNHLAGGANDPDVGLTSLGKDFVRYMENNSIVLDVSHLNQKSFYDVCHLSEGAFIATHSNVQSVFPHNRNLTDDQIKEIIRRNGFIGIAFYPPFLGYGGTIEAILRHMDYILSLGGENVLGFGSDFDGIDQYVENITGSGDFVLLIAAMEEHGYCEPIISKICSDNLVRVLSEVYKPMRK